MPLNQSNVKQLDELRLLPYVELDGARTLSDEIVKSFFRQMVEEGTHTEIFPQGHIRTEEDFLAMLKAPQNVAVFVLSSKALAGVAWLNGFQEHHAFAHFATLKWARGPVARSSAQKIFDYWFSMQTPSGDNIFDLLIGMVPASNISTQRFLEHFAFTKLGAIPNMMQNAYTGERESIVFFYLTRT